jgi:uncharacterized OB-fold protein
MELPRYHRLRGPLYRLEGSHCRPCGALHFPGRKVCPACGAAQSEPHRFRGEGTVWSFSELYQLQRGHPKDVPQLVGLIRLDEGPLILAQITDAEPEQLSIGMRVQMVSRLIRSLGEQGYRVYGYKFRPVIAEKA